MIPARYKNGPRQAVVAPAEMAYRKEQIIVKGLRRQHWAQSCTVFRLLPFSRDLQSEKIGYREVTS